MDPRLARCASLLWVMLLLSACQTVTSVASPAAEPVRMVVTRWPTRTPTLTHTPLPTLTPTATQTPSPTSLPDLTLVRLRNLAYPNEWAMGGVAELVDGFYEEPPDSELGTKLTITLADTVTFGDLDGDRREDAVVVLVARPGDGSSHSYVTIVSSPGGDAAPVSTLALGDRFVLRSMVVATGRLTLELLTYDAGDALCCPSMDSRRIYELDGDTLTLVTRWDGPRQQLAAPRVPARQPLPFAPGTAATLVRGSLYPLGDQRYVLPGQAGQLLSLGITTPHELVFLSLRGLEDGIVLSSIVSETTRWSGELPTTQDYQITLVSLAGSATSYAMAAAVDPALMTSIPLAEGPAATPTATLALTATLTATPLLTSTPILPLTTTVAPGIGDPAPSPARPVVPPGSLIYLTFDGVSEASGWTQTISGVLLDLGVKGTFFLSLPAGSEARALVQAGHAVGHHSRTAQSLDVMGRQALIETLDAAGVAGTRCIRPSYGAMDSTTRVLMAEMGYEVVLWDASLSSSVAVEDEARAAGLLSQVHPGTVLRFQVQDDDAQTAAVLALAVPLLEAEGYGFGTVCLGLDSE